MIEAIPFATVRTYRKPVFTVVVYAWWNDERTQGSFITVIAYFCLSSLLALDPSSFPSASDMKPLKLFKARAYGNFSTCCFWVKSAWIWERPILYVCAHISVDAFSGGLLVYNSYLQRLWAGSRPGYAWKTYTCIAIYMTYVRLILAIRLVGAFDDVGKSSRLSYLALGAVSNIDNTSWIPY